jgi:hypothetical protein
MFKPGLVILSRHRRTLAQFRNQDIQCQFLGVFAGLDGDIRLQ